MFQKALQIAQGFTLPVIVSHRRESGALGSNMATHMVINDEGWPGSNLRPFVVVRTRPCQPGAPAHPARR